jgi:O-methyltransferase
MILPARLMRRMRRPPQPEAAPDDEFAGIEAADRRIIERARPYTMTSVARLHALIEAVRYVTRSGIPGAFAECGVWRGGSILTMIETLNGLGVDDRDIHLFDTFEGMTRPTEHDVSTFDEQALGTWEQAERHGDRAWPEVFGEQAFDVESVRALLSRSGYPVERLHVSQGDVLETIPAQAPESLALLRLDTDWYESTRHELEHLYPRLRPGGVLIIDDYGHWQGCRRAVDEYFAGAGPLLAPVDYTCRIAVKP